MRGEVLDMVFSLPPPSSLIVLFIGLGIGLPVIILVGLVRLRIKNLLTPTSLVFSLCIVMFSFFVAFSYQVSVEIEGSYIKVNCPPYGTKIIYKEEVVKAYVVDWSINGSYHPTMKTAGTAWGSYKAGWFKLENGFPCLLAASNSKNLCLQTAAGYYVLLSPPNFEEFLETVNMTFMPIES